MTPHTEPADTAAVGASASTSPSATVSINSNSSNNVENGCKDTPFHTSSSASSLPQQQQQQNTAKPQRGNRRKLSSKRRDRRRQPESQARKRMEAMVGSLDHKVISACTIALLLLFTFVTISTWMKLPNIADHEHHVPFFQRSSSNSDGGGLPIVPPQQNEVLQFHVQNSGGSPLHKLDDIMDIETLKHTFPIHVGYDRGIKENMEEIDHPGALLAKLTKPKEFENVLAQHPDLKSKMLVPKFWRPTHPFAMKDDGGDSGKDGNVREYLGHHGKELITPEQADAIGSYDSNNMETIYVSVASYRDPECRPTVDDLYERAKYPNRIRVAIIDQVVDGDVKCSQPEFPCSQDPTQVFCKYRHLIDVFEVPAIQSVGPVFARHLANRMYR